MTDLCMCPSWGEGGELGWGWGSRNGLICGSRSAYTYREGNSHHVHRDIFTGKETVIINIETYLPDT